MLQYTKMATIAKTFERAKAENIGISKNLIRELALSGTIPSVLVGKNTRLINWDCLINFLYEGTQNNEPIKNISNVRKINGGI